MKRQSTPFRGLAALALAGLLSLAGPPLRAEMQLIMAEEAGCIWCARWNKEIAPIYPKSPEGQAAPLRRIDIHDPLPDDIAVESRLTYTPTFVLVRDGQELARIEGYPGEDFFWGLLGRMLEEAGVDHDNAG